MAEPTDARRAAGWRRAALFLAAIVLLSWLVGGYFAYGFVDTGISLSYCRAEQAYLRHDLRVLTSAARGRLTRQELVVARNSVDPALVGKTEIDVSLQLQSVSLTFGPDGVLTGMSTQGE